MLVSPAEFVWRLGRRSGGAPLYELSLDLLDEVVIAVPLRGLELDELCALLEDRPRVQRVILGDEVVSLRRPWGRALQARQAQLMRSLLWGKMGEDWARPTQDEREGAEGAHKGGGTGASTTRAHSRLCPSGSQHGGSCASLDDLPLPGGQRRRAPARRGWAAALGIAPHGRARRPSCASDDGASTPTRVGKRLAPLADGEAGASASGLAAEEVGGEAAGGDPAVRLAKLLPVVAVPALLQSGQARAHVPAPELRHVRSSLRSRAVLLEAAQLPVAAMPALAHFWSARARAAMARGLPLPVYGVPDELLVGTTLLPIHHLATGGPRVRMGALGDGDVNLAVLVAELARANAKLMELELGDERLPVGALREGATQLELAANLSPCLLYTSPSPRD